MLRIVSLAIIAAIMGAALSPANAYPSLSGHVSAGSQVLDIQYGSDRRRYSDRRYRWCSNRFSSYDRETNSYWTHSGERRQCRSPYM